MSAIVFSFLGSCAQPPASPKASAEGKGVKVTYGQPSKKGREIFGKLVPYGEVWRTVFHVARVQTSSQDVLGTLAIRETKRPRGGVSCQRLGHR